MSEKKEKKVSEIFSYCFLDKFEIADYENRHIYINCEIDEDVIDNSVYRIMDYNRQDKGKPIEERQPIVVYLNSLGGSVSDGYALIDAIQLSETPVYTVNLGVCFSMGLLIFMAGHKRYAMPHSEFLLHDGQIGEINSTAKVKDRLEFESIQIEGMTKEYILKQSKIDEDLFEKNYRKEWYFLPKEGKDIGIVDYVIGEDCKLADII